MPVTITTDQRKEAMRLMRAHGVSDASIAEAFGLARQRVHVILGARPRGEKQRPDPHAVDAADRLPIELRAWRERRGLSQGDAAQLLGLRRGATIGVWECERGGCKLPGVVLRLCDMLDRYEPPAGG